MKAKKGTVRYGMYQVFSDYADIDDEDDKYQSLPTFTECDEMDRPILSTKMICTLTGSNANTIRGLIRNGVKWGFIRKVRRGYYVLTDDGFTYFYFMTLGAI